MRFASRFVPILTLAVSAAALAAPVAPPAPTGNSVPREPGLLFYLSGDKQTTADFAAGGDPEPNFVRNIQILPNGVKGNYLQCANTQVLSYWAPGNIYSQRGTLSFFWRSRDPVGPTAFPIFRVAFADHSSWDMVWLRIDYNGEKGHDGGKFGGFDAFVTDASLSRVRVSVPLQTFPKPDEWTHLALAWDETQGIRFYINGKLAGEKKDVAFLNVALDQFGPHSRIISPHQVQSDYNFVRGGDLDELKIYDRMLSDDNVAALAKAQIPTDIPAAPARSLTDARWRDEWYTRFGWNRPSDPPPYYPGKNLAIRKVEITDAYDLKRWWWKANDGIPETTWPGVYNRSRLPGRNDYFQLPDWDCYVDSGKAVTFVMPDEPWNQLEISGAAFGKMELLQPGASPIDEHAAAQATLFERAKGNEKTIHHLAAPITGRLIRFTNVEQEQPIQELTAYNVQEGQEPAGAAKLAFRLGAPAQTPPALNDLVEFIHGRFPADERSTLVARPAEEMPANGIQPNTPAAAPASLPIVHVLIPDTWDKLDPNGPGLDGLAIDLPALKVQPTHGEFFPLNIQVKDPLWSMRNMCDFTLSVKPNEAKTLWLDLRDRILPAGHPLYLTIAGAGADFTAASLEGAQVRLIFKPREAARAEHELDRFTQVRDAYAQSTEEHPRSDRLNLWNRLSGDLNDLMRVNPTHVPGMYYAAQLLNYRLPAAPLADPPAGVPAWAFRQVQLLDRVKYFVNYYIDRRQSDFGDLGGGISDDTDLANTWPGTAFMGVEPDKLTLSVHRLLEAAYNNGMFTKGLPTIQADELHSYEEGINCLGENLILDFGNPRQLERAMETQRGIETVTGINSAGHRHFRSSYYNGNKIAEDGPWGWQKPYNFLNLQPGELLVDYNGNPRAKKVLLELADGQLAHRHQDASGRFSTTNTIHWIDDKEGPGGRGYFPWSLYWTAWKFTGDKKYLAPLYDGGTTTLSDIDANYLDILDLRAQWSALPSPAVPPTDRGTGTPGRGRGRGRAAPAPAVRENTTTTGPAENNYAAPGRARGASRTGVTGWQLSGDKSILENLYTAQIRQCLNLEYINTDGSLWIDRVSVPYGDLQRTRLGGIALLRGNLFPGNTVSWRFQAPANDQSAAFLLPDATPTAFKVIAYNLDPSPVHVTMTGWNVDPGTWEMTQGIATGEEDVASQDLTTRSAPFERGGDLELTLPPHATSIITLKLQTPGTPYWQRPDLGISKDDLSRSGNSLKVTVHSLGSVDAPASTLAMVDASGKIVASAPIPALKAPIDLFPKTADITLNIPADARLEGASIMIDPTAKTEEITRRNNRVLFSN
jgi:hypothetical protein